MKITASIDSAHNHQEVRLQTNDVTSVNVTFDGDFGGEGEPGSNFGYKAEVIADAPPEAIEDLIRHTDQVAEIHNTLRKGLSVTLTH